MHCWFAYFPDGAVEPSDCGVSCKGLPTGSSLWWFRLPMEVPPVIHGTVLISDSDLAGIESGDGPLNWFDPFRQAKPVAVIQQGVYVFQGTFAVPLMSPLVNVRRSTDLHQAGQSAEALSLARQAVALTPGSALTQLNLAGLLVSQSMWSEARDHYTFARIIARTVRPDLDDGDLLSRSTQRLAESQRQLAAIRPR